MIVVDQMGRYLGEHTCNASNPHLCSVATKRAKVRGQQFAFTKAHPAYCIYEALNRHLTTEQREWVNEQAPGNGLIP